MFTADEIRTVVALHDALRPRLNADAYRVRSADSVARHGHLRHDVLKTAAMHASRTQISTWRTAA